MKDSIYSSPLERVSDFSFDTEVAQVFDNMISRSVPLYQEVQATTVKIAKRLAQPQSNLYDLGCASGTSLEGLAREITQSTIIGIDSSQAMLDKARLKLQAHTQVQLIQADICECKLENASLIILNYTLQFLPIEKRLDILTRAYQALLPGGGLILSEKVSHRSETLNAVLYEMHHDFKRENGYSELEIAQKREAILNVLLPLSVEDNLDLLKRAGFKEAEIFAKWFNFASFLAFKR